MSDDLFSFRNAIEPKSTGGLESQAGGGTDRQDTDDLSGFTVEATDGSVGKVMDTTHQAGESYLLVDTGATILSKQVVLPAGVVERIDRDSSTVYVDRSQDEIKAAPEFDEERYREAAYRDQLSSHYRR